MSTTKKMFLKIKRIQKKEKTLITIQWDERSPSGWETKTLDCNEPSRPEFHTALNAFSPQVPALIGVHAEWDEHLTVNGITYSYDEYGHRSISIQSIKELEGFNSPLVVNVPFRIWAVLRPQNFVPL